MWPETAPLTPSPAGKAACAQVRQAPDEEILLLEWDNSSVVYRAQPAKERVSIHGTSLRAEMLCLQGQ